MIVDLLPDRSSASLSAWLRSHPSVEVVARDRSTEYKKAITEAAPGAVQVADRWHLLHNLGQALERYFAASRSRLKEKNLGILPIARRLGMSRVTVRKYLSAKTFPEWSSHPSRTGILTPYESHLKARWSDGCRNSLELWREIREQGFPGTYKQVTRWAQLRREEPAKKYTKEVPRELSRARGDGVGEVIYERATLHLPVWYHRRAPGAAFTWFPDRN